MTEYSLADLKDGVGLEKLKPVIQRADVGEKKICTSYGASSSVQGWKRM